MIDNFALVTHENGSRVPGPKNEQFTSNKHTIFEKLTK